MIYREPLSQAEVLQECVDLLDYLYEKRMHSHKTMSQVLGYVKGQVDHAIRKDNEAERYSDESKKEKDNGKI